MSFGQVFYVYWSTLCRLVNFMSFGQVLYVVWSTLCRLVKFYMSTGQLNVVWSSFICLLVNFHIRSRKADLPFAIRARKRELRLQRYVSRITRTEKLFLKLLLFMFHATLIIMSRKYFFRFSKFTHTLRYTILDSRAPLVMRSRKADLPFAIRAWKRELRLQRYVSRITRTEKLFLKLLLFMFHATLIIMSRKYFFRFSKFTHTLRYTILDSSAPLVMRSRKADLPFAIRARKRELRLQRYVSRMTRTENLLSQNFSKFFWKLLLFMFHATLIIMSRKYFFRFSKVTHTLRYTILDSRAPLVMRSRKAGLPFAIRARKLRKLGSSAFRGTYRECTYNRNSRKAVNLISFIYLILVENVTFGPQILWKIRKLGPQI